MCNVIYIVKLFLLEIKCFKIDSHTLSINTYKMVLRKAYIYTWLRMNRTYISYLVSGFSGASMPSEEPTLLCQDK